VESPCAAASRLPPAKGLAQDPDAKRIQSLERLTASHIDGPAHAFGQMRRRLAAAMPAVVEQSVQGEDEGAAFRRSTGLLGHDLLRLGRTIGAVAAATTIWPSFCLNQGRPAACAAHPTSFPDGDGRNALLWSPNSTARLRLPPVPPCCARIASALFIRPSGWRTVAMTLGDPCAPRSCWLWPWDDAPVSSMRRCAGDRATPLVCADPLGWLLMPALVDTTCCSRRPAAACPSAEAERPGPGKLAWAP